MRRSSPVPGYDTTEIMIVEGNQEKLSGLPETTAHSESLDLDLELQKSEEYLN